MTTTRKSPMAVCLALTRRVSHTRTVDEIYAIALDALSDGLGVARASILLFDPDGVMRFKAYRGLSDAYRRGVEGHTPWSPDTPDPQPIVVPDIAADASLAPYLPLIRAERIAAMAFIPLLSADRVIGKFMLYYEAPYALTTDELQLAGVIASQVAFAVERTRAEEQARQSEERLRFALDAALMGTWDWDLVTNAVRWSENLERVHGLPPGTFDGSFASYEREIHPEDKPRVLASAKRAMAEGVPHEVEYRIVAPDGTVRWVEGKGKVDFRDGIPVRMTGVCMVVTRRKEAEQARLAVAEEASRLKDEFLATLSHELRTPLNAILGWARMLQAGTIPAERAPEAIDIIARNAALQARLIEDILDVSRIITGKLEIEREPVFVPALITSVVSASVPAAAAKALEIVSSVPDILPPVDGDPKRLQQVLGNVLSNAIKFTPNGGRIVVRCASAGGWIEIEVADSGEGISAEFLPHIFDRFRQGDSRSTRRHDGLGLGLAIARHLLEQHGGEIRAASDGPGLGTTVTIRLPESAVGSVRAATRDTGIAIDAVPGVRLDGARIVIVDDQKDSCQLLAALVEQCGGQALPCHSATEALEVLATSAARLLVADIAMPEVDGYELIRRVRARASGVHAIAVSAFARPEDRLRALASGYNAYCAKPVDAGEFLRALQQALAA